MSQHDFDIIVSDANTGLTMRAEWDSALQALASVSQGAGSPSTTYPCQLWADTTSNLLKIRNTANTDWVILGALETENWGIASLSGTHEFTVSQRLRDAGNLWRFKDTGAGGKEWGIRCDNGNFLEVCENTGTEAIPVWTVRTTVIDTISETVSTADIADNADTLRNYSPSQTSASGVVVLLDSAGDIDDAFLPTGDNGGLNADTVNNKHIVQNLTEQDMEFTGTFVYSWFPETGVVHFYSVYVDFDGTRDPDDSTNPGDYWIEMSYNSGVTSAAIEFYGDCDNGLKYTLNALKVY